MRVLGGLGVLGGIVVGVLGAVSSHTVGGLDEVVTQITVAALAEGGVVSLELAGFVGRPGPTGKSETVSSAVPTTIIRGV